MMSPAYLFLAFILPALIVTTSIGLGWWPFRKGRIRNGRWLTAVAFPLAFVVAELRIAGSPSWPPGSGDAGFWIVYFAAPLALFGLLDAVFSPPHWLRAGLLYVLSLIAIRLLLAPLTPAQAPTANRDIWDLQTWAIGLAAVVVLVWFSTDALADHAAGVAAPLVMAIVSLGAAAVMAAGNSVKNAQGAAALAGLAIASGVCTFLVAGVSLSRGAVMSWAVLLVSLVVYAHFYAYPDPPAVSLLYFGLVLIAPSLAWAGDLPGVRKWGPKRRLAARVLPVALVVAIAAGLAVRDAAAPGPAAHGGSAGSEDY